MFWYLGVCRRHCVLKKLIAGATLNAPTLRDHLLDLPADAHGILYLEVFSSVSS